MIAADHLAILAASELTDRAMSPSLARSVAAMLRNKAQALTGALETLHEGDQGASEAYRDGCEAIGALVALASALEGV